MAAWLVEYLVRAGSDGGRNGEAEGFGHHAIDDELVARRLLHRKIAGPGTPENAIDESGRAVRDGGEPRPIGDYRGAGDANPFPNAPGPDERQLPLERELPDSALGDGRDVSDGEDGSGARRGLGQRLLDILQVSNILQVSQCNAQLEGCGRATKAVHELLLCPIVPIVDDDDALEPGVDLLEHLYLLDRQVICRDARAGDIAARAA